MKSNSIIQKNMKTLLDMSAHIGTKKWHPSMSYHLTGSRNSIYTMDVTHTMKGLQQALKIVSAIAHQQGHILFVNSNSAYNSILEEVSNRSGHSYINERWVGGTLTNWSMISHEIQTYQKVSHQLDSYSTLLQLSTPRYEKMKKSFQGFRVSEARPDLIFVLGPIQNMDAIHEAWVLNIPTIAICDSDVNLSKITYPIPGNSSSYELIYYCCDIICKTIVKTQGISSQRVLE